MPTIIYVIDTLQSILQHILCMYDIPITSYIIDILDTIIFHIFCSTYLSTCVYICIIDVFSDGGLDMVLCAKLRSARPPSVIRAR